MKLWQPRRRAQRTVPSRTSQSVAAYRAQLVRPHTPDGEADAQLRLCEGMRPARSGALRANLDARTAFFDAQVLAAIDDAIPQVVILGAGYDDRALRFRAPSVHYFELDHPATQSDKRRRLQRIGADVRALTLIEADFRTVDAATVLAAGGHDAGQPSLFICEGLLVYLDQDTIVRLLGSLRSRAQSSSRLAASLAVHHAGLDSDVVTATANGRRRHGESEPWRTILPVAAQFELLARAGWAITDDGGDLEAAVERRTLLVVASPS